MTPDQLKQEINNLPPLPDEAPRFTWLRRRIELRKHINRDDITDFLQWSTICETMFVGNAEYIDKEFQDLTDRYKNVINEPGFGNPEKYPHFNTSGNFIHQAYHLKQWEDITGNKVEDLDRIVEFGGGYGTMALICKRLGFKGAYSLIDFPEYNLLQKYYLSNTVGLNNIQFDWQDKADLAIGLWSLSEVSLPERKPAIDRMRDAKSFLFAYAPTWDKVNNKYWFWRFCQDRKDISWYSKMIKHMTNGWYLIG